MLQEKNKLCGPTIKIISVTFNKIMVMSFLGFHPNVSSVRLTQNGHLDQSH